ncbi:MAG: hypothetical protein Q9161_002006 [Pseudevernia consocians]
MSAGILNEPNTTKTRTEKKANAQSALAPSYAEAYKMIELDRRQPFSPGWGPRPDRGKAKAKEEAPDLDALPVAEHVLKSRQAQAASILLRTAVEQDHRQSRGIRGNGLGRRETALFAKSKLSHEHGRDGSHSAHSTALFKHIMTFAIADRQNIEDGAGSEVTDSADESDIENSDNDNEKKMREEDDNEKVEANIAESDEEDNSDDD